MAAWFMIVAVVAVTAFAALLDARTRRVPNWLTVPFFAAGLVFNTVWQGWEGLLIALGGFAAGFGILLVLWLIGGGGGGDVKLMGALGAWLGAGQIVAVFLLSTALILLASAVLGLARLLRRAASRPADARVSKAPKVPFAVPAALATWIVLAWNWFHPALKAIAPTVS